MVGTIKFIAGDGKFMAFEGDIVVTASAKVSLCFRSMEVCLEIAVKCLASSAGVPDCLHSFMETCVSTDEDAGSPRAVDIEISYSSDEHTSLFKQFRWSDYETKENSIRLKGRTNG